MLAVAVRHGGAEIARFSTVVDPSSAPELHQVLADAIARCGGEPQRIGEYEMDVCRPGDSEPLLRRVAAPGS